ncbi:hypothetical protein JK636_20995 [Clostridium sp. YIM B02515]|uniref:Uncharacterized protein n=1 Tax=Clostridium rhizosphaerae TaxID=2803861 RepID=A0ABS1TFP6_9CLOT|nr:hypothetical protein [Clostridium rhizosphaerae]MBL4938191.1 hypothetical protein [Clostridium rhizosphaerae]
MVDILIIESIKDESFRTSLIHNLNVLGIEYSLQAVNCVGTYETDYTIINGLNSYIKGDFKAAYCLVNTDNSLESSINLFGNMITFGLSGKNTVTVSSIDGASFVYCLQRYIGLNNSKVIEPQELPVYSNYKNDNELYAIMAAITIGLLEGLSASFIEKKLSEKILVLK